MKRLFSYLPRFKNSVQNFKSDFKTKFKENKEKPKGTRKFFLAGVTTAVGIFGLTLVFPSLPAIAKDLPNQINPNPDITPMAPTPPSNEIVKTSVSGLAGSACAIAVTSGSFAVGILCGCIVVMAILKVQGK